MVISILSIKDKVLLGCKASNMSITELASHFGTSQQNMSKRLKNGKLTQDELYQIAKKNCKNTIHIENAKELSKDIFAGIDIKTIGITAGASTPDWIINEVISIMEGF